MAELKRTNVSTVWNRKTPMKTRNPSLPKSATNKQFMLSKQKGNTTLESEQQRQCNEAYASSKEKLLISKIISLKKENNELQLAFKKREQAFQSALNKNRIEIQAMTSLLKQVFPCIKKHMEGGISAQIKQLIEKENLKPQLTDTATQCALTVPESDSGATNKESTTSQSLGNDEDQSNSNKPKIRIPECVYVELPGKKHNDSIEHSPKGYKKLLIENECYRRYLGYMYFRSNSVTREIKVDLLRSPKAINKMIIKPNNSIVPTFIKSLYISQQ